MKSRFLAPCRTGVNFPQCFVCRCFVVFRDVIPYFGQVAFCGGCAGKVRHDPASALIVRVSAGFCPLDDRLNVQILARPAL